LSAIPKLSYQVIDSPERLKQAALACEAAPMIGVDLEADSMYHFRESVCLIQIATPQEIFLIDPLALKNLAPLKPVFLNASIQKVFHGADYDVRSLYRDFKIRIHNLFDTQIACRFLGAQETSLEAVIQERFGVALDKKYQRKDWSVRPLPEKMLAYAARDAVYLIPLAKMLTDELEGRPRRLWVHEECRLLSQVRPATNHTGPLFVNFKGAGRLDPLNLAVLEALLQWRQGVAQKKNRPVFKIIGNRTLLALATRLPTALKALEQEKLLSARQIQMYGHDMLGLIRQAMRTPKSRLPVYPRQKAPPLNPRVPGRIKALRDWRDRYAAVLALDPTLLLNKATLTHIAIEKPLNLRALNRIKALKGWQRRAFGRDIVTILEQVP
jgi:ribonuclease D